MCELYLQALQLPNVLIKWTTIKSIHWYLVAEVEVNCKNCSPLGWWWLTQKLVIPPKDHHSAFRVCHSPFLRTVQLFCLGFQGLSRFPLSFLFKDGSELQQTPWASNTLPQWRNGKPRQDSALSLWRRSSQVSHPAICSAPRTRGTSSPKILQRNAPRKIAEIQSFAEPPWIWKDISAGDQSQVFSLWHVHHDWSCLLVNPRHTSLNQPAQEHLPTPEMANSPPAVGHAMPAHLDGTEHCQHVTIQSLSLCRPILTTVKSKLLAKYKNKNLHFDPSLW